MACVLAHWLVWAAGGAPAPLANASDFVTVSSVSLLGRRLQAPSVKWAGGTAETRPRRLILELRTDWFP